MNAAQTEIGLRLPAPAVSETDVDLLCSSIWTASEILTNSHWVTARVLENYGYTDRELRAIAEASNGRIISGQRGYALMSECTPEEIDRAASWLESQAKKMLARATAIRRRFHGYARTTTSSS